MRPADFAGVATFLAGDLVAFFSLAATAAAAFFNSAFVGFFSFTAPFAALAGLAAALTPLAGLPLA
jgi:hypothetical protein